MTTTSRWLLRGVGAILALGFICWSVKTLIKLRSRRNHPESNCWRKLDQEITSILGIQNKECSVKKPLYSCWDLPHGGFCIELNGPPSGIRVHFWANGDDDPGQQVDAGLVLQIVEALARASSICADTTSEVLAARIVESLDQGTEVCYSF